MICIACRKRDHLTCVNGTDADDVGSDAFEGIAEPTPKLGTWCDCAHITGGANVNHELVPLRHMCPPQPSWLTPCCGKTPFELPLNESMTEDPLLVTCRGLSSRGGTNVA